ncbi:hypothetical protein [Paraburkholderia humisilvae]|uniref:Uncharacterized protein n=1 Tax=Paraburkholderia humisilvae TaxID=627669 RepID=A0A6J5F809_9BURK|nr:hypothetical protein [Paraburkholderia humisilvae]CAB3773385.1 hypothetical protein LMG29542_07220 [Paraburkholderia humisilvae]
MALRTFTHVTCPRGHQGSIVESTYHDSRSHWYLATLRGLLHNGRYDGLDVLFSETTPSCPACGRSLGPEHMTGHEHRTLNAVAVV